MRKYLIALVVYLLYSSALVVLLATADPTDHNLERAAQDINEGRVEVIEEGKFSVVRFKDGSSYAVGADGDLRAALEASGATELPPFTDKPFSLPRTSLRLALINLPLLLIAFAVMGVIDLHRKRRLPRPKTAVMVGIGIVVVIALVVMLFKPRQVPQEDGVTRPAEGIDRLPAEARSVP